PKASLAHRPLWNESLPSIQEARAVLACGSCRPPDSGELAADVQRVIGSRPTLLARDDVLLNANSLRYAARDRGSTPLLFDLDGAILDTLSLEYELVNELLPRHGVDEQAPRAVVRSAFPYPFADSWRRILTAIGHEPDDALVADLVKALEREREQRSAR